MLNRLYAYFTSVVMDDEEGQTLVEYALIIALVSIALIASLSTLSGKIGGVFTEIGTKLDDAI